MKQIADWLEKLGMSEYAQRFAENRIDFSVLPDLTDQDLEKLGVVLGDRRNMLCAIAKLESGTAQPSDVPSTATTSPTARAPVSEAVGERRHVTVMFCDLVDSTGISAKLDAEEWRDLVGAYVDAASAAVTELGGRVAKKLGDGLIQRSLTEVNRKNEGTDKPALAARIAIRGCSMRPASQDSSPGKMLLRRCASC
jgi:hypothetical protein